MWYQGGAVVFAVLLVLFIIQYIVDRKLSVRAARTVQVIAFLAALGGLWATYSDFRTDFTHNILKERFHLGAYLFWVGWISISLFLLATARIQKSGSEVQVKR